MKTWQKKFIETDSGERVEAIFPLILSVSRATDIPALYSKWFFNRLKQGYIAWTNPFNRKIQYVGLDDVEVIIFWTKNPYPMLKYLDTLDSRGILYYFQFTLNDYDHEGLEPNIPSLHKRIDTFKHLSERIGKEKVIWRFDPLLLSEDLTIDKIILRIKNIGDEIRDYCEKLVFSFADIESYNKVKNNLSSLDTHYREFTSTEMEYFSGKLSQLNESWGIELATCSEKVNLDAYGISHNRCVDDELIYRLGSKHPSLLKWLGMEHRNTLSLFPGRYESNPKLKDKGQRKECGCIISKDIGMYNTCSHNCSYCYANHSESTVKRNVNSHNSNSHSII
jgi:DNA repair photolyase